jgi:acyl carrier protein
MEKISRNEALRKIQTIFREQFLNLDLEVSEGSSPETIEEWDSMAHIAIIIAIEGAFSISVSTEEMGEVGAVSDLLDILAKRQIILN